MISQSTLISKLFIIDIVWIYYEVYARYEHYKYTVQKLHPLHTYLWTSLNNAQASVTDQWTVLPASRHFPFILIIKTNNK